MILKELAAVIEDDFITSIDQRESWKKVCSRSTNLFRFKKETQANLSTTAKRPLYLHCDLCNTVVLSEKFKSHLVNRHSDKLKENELSCLNAFFDTKLDEFTILLNQTNANNHEAPIINTAIVGEEKMESPIINTEIVGEEKMESPIINTEITLNEKMESRILTTEIHVEEKIEFPIINPEIPLEEKIESLVINTEIPLDEKMESTAIITEVPVYEKNESSETNGFSRFKKMLDANTKLWNEYGDQLSQIKIPILKAIDEKQIMKEKYESLVEQFAIAEKYKPSCRQILDRAEKLKLLQRKKQIRKNVLDNKLTPLNIKSYAEEYHDNDIHMEEKLRPPCSSFEMDNKAYEDIMAFKQTKLNEASGNANIGQTTRSQPNSINNLKTTYEITSNKESRNSSNIPGRETFVENCQSPTPVIKNIQNNIKNRTNSEEKILYTSINQVEPQQPVKSKNNGIANRNEISNKRTTIRGTPVSNLPINLLANPVSSATYHNLMSSSNYPDPRQPRTNLNMMNNLNPSYHPAITNNEPGKLPIIPPSVQRNFLQTTNFQPDGRSRATEAPHPMPLEAAIITPRISSDSNYNNQRANIHATPDMALYSRNSIPMQPTRMVNNPSVIQNNLFGPNAQSSQTYNNGSANQTPQRLLFDPTVYRGPVTSMVQANPIRNFGQPVQANCQNLQNFNMVSYSSMGQPIQMIPSNRTNRSNPTMQMARMNQPNGMIRKTLINQPNSMIRPSLMTEQEYLNSFNQFIKAEQAQNESQNMINGNNNINPMQGYQMTNNMGSNQIYMGNNNIRLLGNREQGVRTMNQPMAYINVQPESIYQAVNPADNMAYFSPEMANQNMQKMVINQANNFNSIGYHANNENMYMYDMGNYNNCQPSFNNSQPLPNRQPATYMVMQPNEIQPSQNFVFNNNNMIGVVNYQNIRPSNQGQSMVMGYPNVRNTNFSVPNNHPNFVNTYNNGNINNISIRPDQNLPNGNSAYIFFQNPNILNITVPTTNTRNVQNTSVRPTGYNPNMHPYNPNNPNMFQGRR